MVRLKPRSLQIRNLGCSKNLVTSEAIARLFQDNEFKLLDANQENFDKSYIVINTCGFLHSAREEANQEIQKAIDQNPTAKNVIVVGCYAHRFSPILEKMFPGCTIIRNKDPIEGLADTLKLPNKNPQHSRIVSTSYYTYLELSKGCDRSCSFCLIPSIKGPYKSKPQKVLVDEMKAISDQKNVKEVILIAQDTSIYGLDLTPQKSLASLVKEISKISSLEWIRILYLYPTLSVSTMKELLAIDKVIPYFDIPIQHYSQTILSAMNRPQNLKHYLDSLFHFKSKNPSLTFRSTFMVGFPGETEENFKELLSGLFRYPFDRAGFFAFSKEVGTEAIKLKDHIHPSTKNRRLKEAYSFQERISRRENRKWINQTMKVLIERLDPIKKMAYGRTYREAPDVDPEIKISGNYSILKAKVGTIQDITITDADAFWLAGTLVAE